MKHIFLLLSSVTMSWIINVQAAAPLPGPASEEFCIAVQQIMASTEMVGHNTLFTDMPEYRHSKPKADPHNIYQVVTYRGAMPIVVSCKVKGAANLRAVYGDDAAGEQRFCPAVALRVKEQAIAELNEENSPDAAVKVAKFIIVDSEPYITGMDYLSDFELSSVGEDGAIYINSPGLFHDYDSWTTWILPEKFEGQVYCHLATVDYLKALAKGEIEPGTLITTVDDAPVTPQSE